MTLSEVAGAAATGNPLVIGGVVAKEIVNILDPLFNPKLTINVSSIEDFKKSGFMNLSLGQISSSAGSGTVTDAMMKPSGSSGSPMTSGSSETTPGSKKWVWWILAALTLGG
jgi:hypothetical protein